MLEVKRWQVEKDAGTLKRLGKLSEELGELQSVVGRCIIQGVEEVDPESRKTNRLRLEEETGRRALQHQAFDKAL